MATCTWPRLAAAIGCGSNSSNSCGSRGGEQGRLSRVNNQQCLDSPAELWCSPGSAAALLQGYTRLHRTAAGAAGCLRSGSTGRVACGCRLPAAHLNQARASLTGAPRLLSTMRMAVSDSNGGTLSCCAGAHSRHGRPVSWRAIGLPGGAAALPASCATKASIKLSCHPLLHFSSSLMASPPHQFPLQLPCKPARTATRSRQYTWPPPAPAASPAP